MSRQVASLPGVIVTTLTPEYEDGACAPYGDYHKDLASHNWCIAHDIPTTWAQDNISVSGRNVLRGIHSCPGMAKIITCLEGQVWDVIVDLKAMQWMSVHLTRFNHKVIYIPEGYGHGFYTTNNKNIMFYKQSVPYDPGKEVTTSWKNQELDINWHLINRRRKPYLSKKDDI